ncbi:MAG TPA: hypothetical protein VEH54_08555 [Steroidobacteraceae bacterium]|nr:hypothetical protein [Steroidobacteraceae bacterium]
MLRLNGIDRLSVALLLARYGLELSLVASSEPVPSSYWGDSEAGLRDDKLYARLETPVHSVLHETAHYICMSPERRAGLDRDAGGDELEESAVCYLQILLADELTGVSRERLMSDMDKWGYSFRVGSTRGWFEGDAADAREWLAREGLITQEGRPTGVLRS